MGQMDADRGEARSLRPTGAFAPRDAPMAEGAARAASVRGMVGRSGAGSIAGAQSCSGGGVPRSGCRVATRPSGWARAARSKGFEGLVVQHPGRTAVVVEHRRKRTWSDRTIERPLERAVAGSDRDDLTDHRRWLGDRLREKEEAED